jgi:O-antigen/teichoic acid export membrane protein
MGPREEAGVEKRETRGTIARNAFYLVVGQASTTALAIVLSAALGRYLGAGDFGVPHHHDVHVRLRVLGMGPTPRVFSPDLFLLFIDIFAGNVIYASGRGTGFAKAKVLSVLVGTGLDLLLIPMYQTAYGNGGIGVVLSFGRVSWWSLRGRS